MRRHLLLHTLLLAAILASSGGAMAGGSEARLRDMVDALPATLEGWQKADTCEVYTPDDLYVYINGGAELYISYRFATLVSQPYLQDDSEIRLDIFDMGSSAAAFGVFSRSSETVDDFVAPDVESEYASGLLTFWKGPFYCSVLAYPETESKKKLVLGLARTIAEQIDEPSTKPALLAKLPATDRVPHSERFFWHHAWINEYHFFSNENLLNLGEQTDVVMAKYRPVESKQKPAVLVAVQYPGTETATAAHKKFADVLMGGADNPIQQEDETWLACHRMENHIMIVAAAPNKETAQGLIETFGR